MVGPIHNTPNIRPGAMAENIAASGSFILNQVDREILKERVGDTPRSGSFLTQIRGLLGKLSKIDDSSAARDSEKSRQDKDLEALEHRVKLERKMIRLAPSTPEERVELQGQTKEEAPPKDLLGAPDVDLQLLKQYAISYANQILKEPSPKVKLDKFTRSLQERIPEKVRTIIERSVEETLFAQIARILRTFILTKLKDPVALLQLLLKVRLPVLALSIVINTDVKSESKTEATAPSAAFASLEILGSPRKNYRLFELALLAKGFGVNLQEILAAWRMDTVTITSVATIELDMEKQISPEEKAELFTLYRNVWIAYWLELSSLKRAGGTLELKRLRTELRKRGARDTELAAMEKEARKIAWLYCVSQLKELHVKRVFCGTEKEFMRLSRIITELTRRARHLGQPIAAEGVKWVEARLEVMALQAAEYKLNLLASMQKLSFDKAREKDVTWLTKTIEVLKKRVPG